MNPDCIDEKKNALLTPAMIVEAIYSAIESRRPRWWELECEALKLASAHPEVMEACVAYAREIVEGRWDDLEPVILQAFVSNPVVGREYMEDCYEVDVIGEYVWGYLDVINGPWPEWEQAIVGLAATNIDLLHSCVRYAKERIKKRWNDLETLLLRALLADNKSCVWTGSGWMIFECWLIDDYMSDVVAGPWPELEAVILDHGWLLTFGVSYAIGGRKSRWRELEERMFGFGYGSSLGEQIEDIVCYAAELFEGRPWPEAERFFKEDLRKRFPEAAAKAARSYAEYVIKGRWEAGEELMSGFPFQMSWYAQWTLKHPLPDHLHAEMVMRSFEAPDDPHIKDYFKWCNDWATAAQGGAP